MTSKKQDIVARLRDPNSEYDQISIDCDDAADEIERLRAAETHDCEGPALSLLRQWLLASSDWDMDSWVKRVRDLVEDGTVSDEPCESFYGVDRCRDCGNTYADHSPHETNSAPPAAVLLRTPSSNEGGLAAAVGAVPSASETGG